MPAGIREKFLTISDRVPDGYRLEYRPGLLGKGKDAFRPKGGRDRRVADMLLAADRSMTRRRTISGKARRSAMRPRRPKMRPTSRLNLPICRRSYRATRATRFSQAVEGASLSRGDAQAVCSARCSRLRRSPTRAEADFRSAHRAAACRKSCAEARESSKSRTPAKLADANDRVLKAQAKVSTRRWQFLPSWARCFGSSSTRS